MKMIRDVNRAMLSPNQRSTIKDMIKAFELCHKIGERNPKQYICYRLEGLHDKGRIKPDVMRNCQSLVMRAIDASTLNAWWYRELSSEQRLKMFPGDMPRHYRQLWLKQIIKDLRWLLE